MEEREPAAFLTVDQVAAVLQTKPFTVNRLLRTGQLAGVNLGTKEGWRVRRADVDALITLRTQKG